MASNPNSHSVLVVDDEANLRNTLAVILQRAGYWVTTASSVQEARQLLLVGPYDLVFLDLKMPEVDGLALLPEIRQKYPEMPVLILTAHATLDSAIQAVRQGARDYLLKPIDPVKIIQRVNEILSESIQPRRRRQIVGEIQDLLSELNQIESAEPAPKGGQPPLAGLDHNRYLQRGELIIDLHARHVTLHDRAINLSPTAFEYLVTLLRHSPNPVSYETLVTESQGYQPSLIEARDMARWRIHELRKSLEDDSREPRYIITVRGMGYRLVI